MEEAAERIHSKTSLLQLTQEKQQMELSHKRARIELEKEAHNSSRDLQVKHTPTVLKSSLDSRFSCWFCLVLIVASVYLFLMFC